jgi:hypothetical protein
MACHAGDEVTVRIADHKATVTGNASAPATDDHAANVAHGVASVAQETATVAQDTAEVAQNTAIQAKKVASNAATKADVAEIAAQEAARVASAVNQHFWDDERGAHVTEEKKDDYLNEPSGFQNLMTSLGNIFTKAVEGVERILRSDTASGMVVYDGECAPDAADLADHAVAAFTGDGVQIGKNSDAHIEMDFNSFKMVDKDGGKFFVVDDLRDETGVATITETYRGDGGTTSLEVMLTPDSYVSVTDSSHEGAAYTTSGRTVRFSVAPSNGATVTVTYKTSSPSAKSYTLGRRVAGSAVGAMSVAEGDFTIASGTDSHAEGGGTTASGTDSHAEGIGTIASDYASHAEGAYTIASDYASHSEGIGTTASGYASHAEGDTTTASGRDSHAEGDHTDAMGNYQHVQGKYNVSDSNNTYAHIIGNGTDTNHRRNAHTVDWSGNAWYAGNVSADGALSCADGSPYCSDGTNVKVGGATVGSADNLSYVASTDTFRAPTTHAATRHPTNTSTGSIHYIRCGKLVIVSFSLNVTATTNNAAIATGLPKPQGSDWFVVAGAGSNQVVPMYVSQSTGELRLNAAHDARWWVGTTIYESAD